MAKIAVENVNHPESATNLDAEKYHAVRRAILASLPSGEPGATVAELQAAVRPRLPEAMFPGGAKAGWWVKAVHLDLEAKGVIARGPKSPVRLRKLTDD